MWEGIPNDLDEALVQKNGVIYFLKGLRHWTYQDEAFKVKKLLNSSKSNGQ